MTTLEEIGAKIEAGERLGEPEAAAMVETTDLLGLGALADDSRRRRHGIRTTFVRVHAIEVEAGLPATQQIPAGAGEIRLVGSVSSLEEAVNMVRAVAPTVRSAPLTGFSLDQLGACCDWRADLLADGLRALADQGLTLVSDAHVEALPGPEWLDVVAGAGLRIGRLAVTEVADHGGVELIRRVSGWGEALGHVHALAPLSRVQPSQPTTGYRDLRQVALARLLVDNIDSIQVDWGVYGPKLAQVALMFGADDIDTVSPSDGHDLGWRRAPLEEITRNIRAAAMEPVERDGRFEIVGR